MIFFKTVQIFVVLVEESIYTLETWVCLWWLDLELPSPRSSTKDALPISLFRIVLA
ncbi:hypothetical protein JHK87_042871 [Glycine soja]|nr:hypothetical protein JHK87_042871 [Glycine soja]